MENVQRLPRGDWQSVMRALDDAEALEKERASGGTTSAGKYGKIRTEDPLFSPYCRKKTQQRRAILAVKVFQNDDNSQFLCALRIGIANSMTAVITRDIVAECVHPSLGQ